MRPNLEAHPVSDRWLQYEGTSVTVALAMTEDAGERIRNAWNATRDLHLKPDTNLRDLLTASHTCIEMQAIEARHKSYEGGPCRHQWETCADILQNQADAIKKLLS